MNVRYWGTAENISSLWFFAVLTRTGDSEPLVMDRQCSTGHCLGQKGGGGHVAEQDGTAELFAKFQ